MHIRKLSVCQGEEDALLCSREGLAARPPDAPRALFCVLRALTSQTVQRCTMTSAPTQGRRDRSIATQTLWSGPRDVLNSCRRVPTERDDERPENEVPREDGTRAQLYAI